MDLQQAQAQSAWAPYEPSDQAPWNLERVVHLHRRAGFGGSWSELQRDLSDGPRPALERLLSGKVRDQGSDAFNSIAKAIGEAATASGNADRLKAWWLHRMVMSPDPLGERLTLMWHNHFATSNRKVDNLVQMRAQNNVFRDHARAPFAELLAAVIKQPAMLVWLDAESNRKGKSNENLARELMELFTLGIGNYSEQDVKEGARALTGWSIAEDHFQFRESLHDEGQKQVLGKSGPLNGDDLLALLVEQPATSRRLAWRLVNTFMGEGVAHDTHLEELAAGLREHNLDIGWGVSTLLQSRLFFSEDNLQSRVASPVDLVVGSVCALDLLDDPPSSLLLAECTTRMGQDLFYPPNVGGWREGRAWLSSRSIIARANFAELLTSGRLWQPDRAAVIQSLLERYQVEPDVEPATEWLATLLWGTAPQAIVAEVVAVAASAPMERRATLAATLLLAHPQNQLT